MEFEVWSLEFWIFMNLCDSFLQEGPRVELSARETEVGFGLFCLSFSSKICLQECAQPLTAIRTNDFYPFVTRFPPLTKLQVKETSREIFISYREIHSAFSCQIPNPFSCQILLSCQIPNIIFMSNTKYNCHVKYQIYFLFNYQIHCHVKCHFHVKF